MQAKETESNRNINFSGELRTKFTNVIISMVNQRVDAYDVRVFGGAAWMV